MDLEGLGLRVPRDSNIYISLKQGIPRVPFRDLQDCCCRHQNHFYCTAATATGNCHPALVCPEGHTLPLSLSLCLYIYIISMFTFTFIFIFIYGHTACIYIYIYICIYIYVSLCIYIYKFISLFILLVLWNLDPKP